MAKSPKKDATEVVVSVPHREPHGYEFLGPPGTFVLTFGLPVLCYAAFFLCNDLTGCPVPVLLPSSRFSLAELDRQTGWSATGGLAGLFDLEATLWMLSYYLLSLVLYRVLPADHVEGTVLRDGGRLKYRFNAFPTAVLILSGCALGTAIQGADFVVWRYITDHHVHLFTANVIVSYAVAMFVYVRSFQVKPGDPGHRLLAEGGHSGNLIYDFWIGRELNPRVTLPFFGEIDVKMWFETRPGLLGWVLLDLAFAAKQYRTYGHLTDSMLLLVAFQSYYVLDGLYMESSCLTMMDITTDGFGFMLAFGDVPWLPFTYSLQARYLSVYPFELGVGGVLAVLAFQAAGYWLFRSANSQKDEFRRNPDHPRHAHLESIRTERGTRLLTSGWWGLSRHINYLGDWTMGWSYCLPTGLAGYVVQRAATATATGEVPSVVQGEARGWGVVFTYFYLVYFAVLLIHRQRRDDAKCARKYGKDWELYQKKVPWRIVPYVY